MKNETVVFVGPTIAPEQVKALLPDAHLMPPVACGDVIKVLLTIKPARIAIIDGFFEHVGSVWHKEIILAMQQGVAVYGASSMGALRAAELHEFGMIGVGEIFQAYASAVLEDDDEVAVIHRPEKSHYEPISVAMVNVRATVASALAKQVISKEVAEQIITTAKSLFYKDRMFAHIIKLCSEQVTQYQAEFLAFLAWVENGGYVDQKKLDALALLNLLQRFESEPLSAKIGAVKHTFLLTKLLEKCACEPDKRDFATAAAESVGFVKYVRILAYLLRSLDVLADVLVIDFEFLLANAEQHVVAEPTIFQMLLLLFEPELSQQNMEFLTKIPGKNVKILKILSLYIDRLQKLTWQHELYFDGSKKVLFLQELLRANIKFQTLLASVISDELLFIFMLIKCFLNNGADVFLVNDSQAILRSYFDQAKQIYKCTL